MSSPSEFSLTTSQFKFKRDFYRRQKYHTLINPCASKNLNFVACEKGLQCLANADDAKHSSSSDDTVRWTYLNCFCQGYSQDSRMLKTKHAYIHKKKIKNTSLTAVGPNHSAVLYQLSAIAIKKFYVQTIMFIIIFVFKCQIYCRLKRGNIHFLKNICMHLKRET